MRERRGGHLPARHSAPCVFAQLVSEAEWPAIEATLAECVEEEVLQLVQKLPYSS